MCTVLTKSCIFCAYIKFVCESIYFAAFGCVCCGEYSAVADLLTCLWLHMVSVCVCVCVCARACVCVCVCMCVCANM